MDFTKHEKTNFLPLRWSANLSGYIAHYFLERYLDGEFSGRTRRLKFYGKVFDIFQKPSTKWGTYYLADIKVKTIRDQLKKEGKIKDDL